MQHKTLDIPRSQHTQKKSCVKTLLTLIKSNHEQDFHLKSIGSYPSSNSWVHTLFYIFSIAIEIKSKGQWMAIKLHFITTTTTKNHGTYPCAMRDEWTQWIKSLLQFLPPMLRNQMMNLTARNHSPWWSFAPRHWDFSQSFYMNIPQEF